MTRLLAAAVALALGLVLAVASQATHAQGVPRVVAPPGGGTVIAVGDISNPPGGLRVDVATAALIAPNGAGLVLPLGDIQYETGQCEDFAGAYDLSWGKYKDMTRPTPGNHEYLPSPTGGPLSADTEGASCYFSYFGPERAGVPPGYYSFDFQGVHFAAVNSTCTVVPGGCGPTSPTYQWLKADLSQSTARCQVVYMHHPYKGSNALSKNPVLASLWSLMVTKRVDLVLNGHMHAYERTAPFRTMGNIDYDAGPGDGDDGLAGIRSITAGTGGRSLIPFGPPVSQSRYRKVAYGVLKLVPYSDHLTTAFKGTDGQSYDRVSWGCN